METTSHTLAAHFESKLHDAVSLLRTLDDTDWGKVTEAEQWSVGVTALHYASILEPVGELRFRRVSSHALMRP